MKLLRRFEHCADFKNGSVVTIGNFDGVHLGHRALLALVVEESRRLGVPSCVMSFEPMPSEYFGAANSPGRLSTWRERYEQIQIAGIDVLYLAPFTKSMANMSPEEFVNTCLVKRLNLSALHVGDDFRFGKGRAGTVEILQQIGDVSGFHVHQMSSLQVEHARVSSSLIRAELLAGNLNKAEQSLGRRYSMSGRVVYGKQLGKKLGFPTANIHPRRNCLPLTGVFAVRVYGAHPHGPLDGVASLGFRPTVGGGEALLEANIFDFDGDLYGHHLTIEFIAKLRDEEHFASIDLMVDQMHLDAKQARAILAETDS